MANNEEGKDKAQKHQWTTVEDAKLVECMLDLAANGWKSDNGTFKPGYLKQLEKWLHEKLPGCELKAYPHVESRFKLLKKQYSAIADMLGPCASGFGWNDKENCVVVEKHIFDEWVKSHPAAKGLRNKPFPHYQDLTIVFGEDRANGGGAEGPEDAVEAIDKEEIDTNHIDIDEALDLEDPSTLNMTQQDGQTIMKDTGSNEVKRGKKRVRNSDSSVDQLLRTMTSLGDMYQAASNNMSKIAACFQYEADAQNRRMKVFEEVSQLTEFSDDEKLEAGELITSDSNKIDYFFTLPLSYKNSYIRRLLVSKK